jgi:hypothetical protein
VLEVTIPSTESKSPNSSAAFARLPPALLIRNRSQLMGHLSSSRNHAPQQQGFLQLTCKTNAGSHGNSSTEMQSWEAASPGAIIGFCEKIPQKNLYLTNCFPPNSSYSEEGRAGTAEQ